MADTAHTEQPSDTGAGDGPSREQLRASLAMCVGSAADEISIRDVQELTPGISEARIFRVVFSPAADERLETRPNETAAPRTVILKVPDWGGSSGLKPRDPRVRTREVSFYESGLAGKLPAGLRAPRLLGIDRHVHVAHGGRGTWAWLEDVREALAAQWDPARLLEAARRNALLSAHFLAHRAELEAQDWLEREGYAAYTHHVPAAHRHVARAAEHPEWAALFTSGEREQLHRALDLWERAAAELRQLPLTFIHGDFHPNNLGFDLDGTLVAIDWEHAGLAPPGCDVATLLSLYGVMGGSGDAGPGSALEREALEVYCDSLERECPSSDPPTGAALRNAVRRAAGLWHLTWGLHLRLGPGLDWLLRRPDAASDEAARDAADVRKGCLRALAFLREPGV